MMLALKVAHWVGVLMLLSGLTIYGLTSLAQQIDGMLLVSSLIGLGLVLMSPFPVVLFIQWGQKQEKQE